jgi:hypothetical protein
MKCSKHPPICAACRPPPEPSVEVSESRSRWLFVLSGLSAAAISAALTWFLVISPQRQQKSQPAPEDLATVVDLAQPIDLAVVDAASSTAPARSDLPTVKTKEPVQDPAKDPAKENAARAIPAEDKQRPSEGQVLIRSEPPGATVLIDKEEIGVTPLLLLDRTPGEDFKIELLLDGYKKGRKRVHWRDKDRLDVKVKLQSLATEGSTDPADSKGEASDSKSDSKSDPKADSKESP